jgi:hypothetical protein
MVFFALGIAAENTNSALLAASVNNEATEVIAKQNNTFIAETGYQPKITIFDDYSNSRGYGEFHYEMTVLKSEQPPVQKEESASEIKKTVVTDRTISSDFYAELELDEIQVIGVDQSLEYIGTRLVPLEVTSIIDIPETLNFT